MICLKISRAQIFLKINWQDSAKYLFISEQGMAARLLLFKQLVSIYHQQLSLHFLHKKKKTNSINEIENPKKLAET